VERPPQATSQPVPAVKQALPPVSGSIPQRMEQPQRSTTPSDSQIRPSATPSRGEVRQVTPIVPVPVPPKPVAPQRVEQPRRDSAPKELQQRKVWQVTTPESANDKEPRGSDNRGRDRR
jgi:hypothetical protein